MIPYRRIITNLTKESINVTHSERHLVEHRVRYFSSLLRKPYQGSDRRPQQLFPISTQECKRGFIKSSILLKSPEDGEDAKKKSDSGDKDSNQAPLLVPRKPKPMVVYRIRTPEYVNIIPISRTIFPDEVLEIKLSSNLPSTDMTMTNPEVGRLIGVFRIAKDVSFEKSTLSSCDQVEEVGVLAIITKVRDEHGGSGVVSIRGIRRIKIIGPRDKDKEENSGFSAYVQDLPDIVDLSDEVITGHVNAIMYMISSYLPPINSMLGGGNSVAFTFKPSPIAERNRTLSFMESVLRTFNIIPHEKRQLVLSTVSLKERLNIYIHILKERQELRKISDGISAQVEEKFKGEQTRVVLTERLKALRKELGVELDDKTSILKKIEQSISQSVLPKHAMEQLEEELNKLKRTEPISSEFHVSRNFIDWILALPWLKYSNDNYDINRAKKVLDEDHYGMNKLKTRILEFIAVGKLRNSVVQGKIICLVGPPGVGKTSVGKSVARALDREYHRISVGGMSDAVEIKGSRRTYVGAMPGKIIQSLKSCKFSNPVIMIDEVDKLAVGAHGSPAAVLLEVLDPEQNFQYVDHFLEIPYDLSKVLFICTANVKSNIPKTLIDRMEVIDVPGYTLEEKVHIAKGFLVPKIIKEIGLPEIKFSDSILHKLIKEYCREAGVRNLEKQLEKIGRKMALSIAKKQAIKKQVLETDLEHFLGLPLFTRDRLYDVLPIGVSSGLSAGSMGGSLVYIECIENPFSQNNFVVTGSLGEVMKESTSIAYTVAKNFLDKNFPENTFIRDVPIHLHVPEGATPKDGPSGGVSMTTALLSLALSKRVPSNIAMTGEITLTGRVLAIGGVKDKILAAKRAGITEVILPNQNLPDWSELEKDVTAGVKVHFVDYYDEVYKILFVDNNAEIAVDVMNTADKTKVVNNSSSHGIHYHKISQSAL